MAGKTRNYEEEFKRQVVSLYNNGKSSKEISNEYTIAKSTVTKWIRDYNNSGSFKAKKNRTEEENELLKLKKENKQLLMEIDILKQATLIICKK